MAQQQITLANYSDLEGMMYATDTDQPTGEVEFTSYDTTLDPTTTESVALLTSSDTWGSRFQKISQMFKNIRYLLKMLGTTSISSIGNGTVTGALSTLNSNLKTASKTVTGTTNVYGTIALGLANESYEVVMVKSSVTTHRVIPLAVGSGTYGLVLSDVAAWTPVTSTDVTLAVIYRPII